MRLFGLAASAIITLSIILSGSRAGILAVVIVAAVYLGHRYCGLLKKHRNFIFPLSGIIFVILVAGLFLLKKDSALGRILITEKYLRDDFPPTGVGLRTFGIYAGIYALSG